MNRHSDLSPAVAAILESLPKLRSDGRYGETAPMLTGACYTSPEFFEFEKKAVFARSWICVGHEGQIPSAGDYLAPEVAGEPLIVVRGSDGAVRAMTAVCQHRGQIITCGEAGTGVRAFRCPLHFWTYDLEGRLIGATRTAPADMESLRKRIKLPPVRLELWHGFLFVNLDAHAAPLAPSLAKLEPYWEGYEQADLVCVPPAENDTPLPWNWKIHAENFTDAYHPEFVHRGTHDFAPSNHPDGGVKFTPFKAGDNAIVRSVPLLKPDGGMMTDGWGEQAAFPAIPTIPDAARRRLTFALLPPGMTIVFAPGAVAYQLVRVTGVRETLPSNDRVTAGGWLLPKSTIALPDFKERTARVQEGARKIWQQDIPVNLGVQLGKASRFIRTIPEEDYNRLEGTLPQFNAWLVHAYRQGLEAISGRQPARVAGLAEAGSGRRAG